MISRFYFDKTSGNFVLCVSVGFSFSASFLTCINRYLEMFDFSEKERLEYMNNCKKLTTKQAKSYLNKLTSCDYIRTPLSLF